MRIISKFHDYYDVGMKYGQDKKVVYVRETEDLPASAYFQHNYYLYKWDLLSSVYKKYEWNRIVFSVCGKFYVCYHFYIPICNCYGKDEIREDINYYCYTIDELKSVTRAHCQDLYNRLSVRKLWRESRTGFTILEEELKNQGKPFSPDIHQKFKTPIIISRPRQNKYRLEKDVNLSRLEFYKIEQDPIKLFQDIYMFISGIIGTPENNMAKINNEERIITHGFDLKYSFRKRPK